MVAYTDTGGYFKYDGLGPGSYSLEAVDDSNKYDKGVERVTINRAERVSVQVYLRDKSATTEKTTGEVVSAYSGDQNVPGPAKREFDQARQLSKDGRADEAIEHYNRAIQIYPAYLMAHNDLGVQFLSLGKLDNAAGEFGAAIDIDPKAFNPRLNLAIVLIQEHRYPEALDQLTTAVSIDSSQAAGHFYLGVASLGGDDLDAAKRELGKALTIGGPQYSVAHYHLAGVHLRKGERDQAIHELETYLATSPTGDQARQAKQLLEQIRQH
jgi:tetratricopeptide (TPR) repeat protein